MAWMLQPHSYAQVVKPNLYRVDYRRNGAYKGMGRGLRGLGQTDLSTCLNPVYPNYPDLTGGYCADTPAYTPAYTPACMPDSAVGPLQPNQVYCQSGTNISSVTAPALTPAQAAAAAGATTTSTMSTWLPWVLGGGLVVLLLAGGRR